MLNVSSPAETFDIISEHFNHIHTGPEEVQLFDALGRVLFEDISSAEDLPAFTRSTVDGYAVCAKDTFGSSGDIPAILAIIGEVPMGDVFHGTAVAGECVYIPTGGALPEGTDAVVMVEYIEDYGDGTVGVLSAVAPGQNLIPAGADISTGALLLEAGTSLKAHDIGALAALGLTGVCVFARPRVGILSTGDELVAPGEPAGPGQIRDINTGLLSAAVQDAGGKPVSYGICRDRPEAIKEMLIKMAAETDIVVLSGGSSAGAMDAAYESISGLGQVYLHGIAIKPGKPTIVGEIDQKPVFGLPGNPLAAYFIFRIFVEPLIGNMQKQKSRHAEITKASLSTAISSNHGREEYVLIRLREDGGAVLAEPVASTSGLITKLAGADGYIRIPRDSEGLSSGAAVDVIIF